MARRVEGIQKTLINLNKEINGIQGRTMRGLLEAGLKVQRLSQKHTPREYGNLVNSAYTRRAQGGELAVEVGYTASYAVYVHENLEQKWKGRPRRSGLGVYWGPAGRPRFLYQAMIELKSEILSTIRQHAKVPEKRSA